MGNNKLQLKYFLPIVGFALIGLVSLAVSFANSSGANFDSSVASLDNAALFSSDNANEGEYLQFVNKLNFAQVNGSPVYRVADYGALPDDGKDDTTSISNALEAAKSTGGTVEFSRGTYDISGQTKRDPAANGADRFYAQMFRLVGFHNLHIKGNDTTLKAKNWATIFFAQNSSDLIISGFTVDWSDDLPFTAGKITAMTDNYVDLQVNQDHPVRGSTSVDYFIEWDGANNRPPKDGYRIRQPNTPTNCKVLSGRNIRCTKATANSAMAVGDDIVVSFKKNGHDFVVARKTDGLTLDNLKVYSQPGLVLSGAGRTRDVKVSNVYIGRKPGSQLALSASAGATNNAAMETRGELLQVDSIYRNTEDDGANTGNLMMKITNVINSTDLVIKYVNPVNFLADGTRMPFNGDVLAFGSSNDPLVDSSFGVVSNTNLLSDGYRISLRDSTSGLNVGDIVRNNSAAPINSVFRNLTIEEGNAHGIRVHSKNVLIENSSFARIQGPQIISELFLEPFAAGIVSENLFILNNTFNSGNFGRSKKTGAISLVASHQNTSPSKPIFNNINICGNTFKNTRDKAIHLESTSNANLGGNAYDKSNPISNGSNNSNIKLSGKCQDYKRAHYQLTSLSAGQPLIPASMVDIQYQGTSKINCPVPGVNDELFSIKTFNDGRQYLVLKADTTASNSQSEVCISTDYGSDRLQQKYYTIEFVD